MVLLRVYLGVQAKQDPERSVSLVTQRPARPGSGEAAAERTPELAAWLGTCGCRFHNFSRLTGEAVRCSRRCKKQKEGLSGVSGCKCDYQDLIPFPL